MVFTESKLQVLPEFLLLSMIDQGSIEPSMRNLPHKSLRFHNV